MGEASRLEKFLHFDPKTIEEAVSLLKTYEPARVIAGGTYLLQELKSEINPAPKAIINLKAIPGLSYIKEDAEGLKLGALTTLAELEANTTVKATYSSLAEAAHAVASPLIRNMGTIGGNLCQRVQCLYYRNKAYYCLRKGGTLCFAVAGYNRWYNSIFGGMGCYATNVSDTAIALCALNARAKTSERTVAIDEFFTDLDPGIILKSTEVLTEIQVPKPAPGTKQKFLKFRFRKSIEFALASVGVALSMEGATVKDARVFLGGVAPRPYRATGAEEALKGKPITDAIAESAGKEAVGKAIPLTMNKYVVNITKALVTDALLQLK